MLLERRIYMRMHICMRVDLKVTTHWLLLVMQERELLFALSPAKALQGRLFISIHS